MEMKEFVCFENEDGIKKNVLVSYEGKSKDVVIPSEFDIIESSCFGGNSVVESVEIPESVKMIKDKAFDGCTNLKSVKIPGGLVSVAPDAFGDVESTAKILLENPNYIEENGLIINKVFKSVLFVLDSSKESYCIPEGMEIVGAYAFLGCENLKEISIPEGVVSLEMMSFFGCSSLSKVNFPESLKTVGAAAFAMCNNLKDFTIPENVEIVKVGNEILVE